MGHPKEDNDSPTAAEAHAARVRGLEEAVARLEEQLAELDARNLELEQLAATRGVKLNCANIALSRSLIAFDEAAKRREEMVREVSHDLRTPLTSIKGAAQNMLDGIAGELTEDAREYVKIMRDHADRLIDIVNWLVESMKVSAVPVELQTSEVDVAELARRVVRGLAPIADERGIELTCALASVQAAVDEARLHQVLENLVGNALKFTNEGGSVGVTVTEDGKCVRIAVKDTGIGMGPEEANRVFDRYYRRGDSRGGTGLGLAISREIVRLHGGDITVKTKPNEGSEFVVALPRTAPLSGA